MPRAPNGFGLLNGIAHRLGALLIVDDVQAGVDVPAISSALRWLASFLTACALRNPSAVASPMALVLIKEGYDQWAPGEHNGTFRGNNLAFVTATIAVQLWQEQRFTTSLRQSAGRIRKWIDDVVTEFGDDCIRRKGRGLFCGLAFTDHKLGPLAAAEAFRRRLLIETSAPYDEVLKILPPLTLDPNFRSVDCRCCETQSKAQFALDEGSPHLAIEIDDRSYHGNRCQIPLDVGWPGTR